MSEPPATVMITLKDVYQQTQSLEKSLSDSMATLNLTMVSIKNHLEQLDTRNAAADELHKEQGDRIRKAEAVLSEANLPVRLPDVENRLRSLERFKYTLLGAVVLLNALSAWLMWVLSRPHG